MWNPESNPWEAAPPVPTREHWVVHSSFTSHSFKIEFLLLFTFSVQLYMDLADLQEQRRRKELGKASYVFLSLSTSE